MVRLLGLIGMLPEVDPSAWDHREVRMFLIFPCLVLYPDCSEGRTDMNFPLLYSFSGGTLRSW